MKQKNLLFRIFLVIFLVAVAGIIGLLVRDHIQKDKDRKLREKAAVSVQEEPEVSAEPEETPVQIPVDFSVLQAENPDIYAWIRIADTPVDYPILQSKQRRNCLCTAMLFDPAHDEVKVPRPAGFEEE